MRDSGLEDCWIESGLFGASIANKIITGKHYYRSLHAHELTYEALLVKLFESFSTWLTPLNDASLKETVQQLKKVKKYSIEVLAKGDSSNLTIIEALEQFECVAAKLHPSLEEFIKTGCTQSKTFRFWYEYLQMMEILQLFIYSDRNSDWNAHLNGLAQMLPYDRAFDHLNYFRWGMVYLVDMRLLPESAPSIHDALANKQMHAVSRARTHSIFNTVSADMALEQSQNKDSKMKGGLSGIAAKEETRERWTLTAHLLASVAGSFRDMCFSRSTTSKKRKEIMPSRIQADRNKIKKLSNTIDEIMQNPFNLEKVSSDLVNIATGLVMPADVATRLLDAKSLGEHDMQTYFQDRISTNQVKFNEPIKKLGIKTFSSLNKPVKTANSRSSVIVKQDRQCFSRLLVVGQKRKVDLQNLLSYELSSVPVSLCHNDGSLRKTQKSVLLHELEKGICSSSMKKNIQAITVVDLMATIQSIPKSSKKRFGEFSIAILENILAKFKESNQIHVVPDRYFNQSIKDLERNRRGSKVMPLEVMIHSADTKLPGDIKRFLTSNVNKNRLLDFISHHWTSIIPTHLSPEQSVFLALIDGTCVKVTSNGIEQAAEYNCDHEEADTRMLLHCRFANEHGYNKIILCSPDTDVAILCCYHFKIIGVNEFYFHTGTGSKRRYIPIHVIVSNLGDDICQSLPSVHALSGCDTTASLCGIGKKKVFKVTKANSSSLHILDHLGTTAVVQDENLFPNIRRFISFLYNDDNPNLDKVRYRMFTKKNLDSTKLPPTNLSADIHVRMCNYQVYI